MSWPGFASPIAAMELTCNSLTLFCKHKLTKLAVPFTFTSCIGILSSGLNETSAAQWYTCVTRASAFSTENISSKSATTHSISFLNGLKISGITEFTLFMHLIFCPLKTNCLANSVPKKPVAPVIKIIYLNLWNCNAANVQINFKTLQHKIYIKTLF